MRQYTGAPGSICAVARVGAERRQVVGLTREALVVWDEGAADPVQQLPVQQGHDTHTRLHADPGGAWLATTCGQHLNVWRLAGGAWREHLQETDAGLCAARFTGPATLRVVSTAAAPGDVEFVVTSRSLGPRPRRPAVAARFRVRPSDLAAPLHLHASHYWAADLSPDGRWLLLSACEKAVHVWDAEAGRAVGTVKLRGIPNEAAFAPDGLRFAVDGGTTVYVHDSPTLALVTTWRVPHCYTPRLAWSPDGRWLARASQSSAVRKYNLADNREGQALAAVRERNGSVAFSDDGSTYLAGTARGSVLVWDLDE